MEERIYAGIGEKLLAAGRSTCQDDFECRRSLGGSRLVAGGVLFVFHGRHCSAFRPMRGGRTGEGTDASPAG